ncbi:MAG: ROK family protein [Anaerolineales bacterium]
MVRRPVTGDQMLIRKMNTSIVLDCLRMHAPLSRANLAERTGLNRSTISSIVSDLIDQTLVRETEYQSSGVGRPGMSLELDPRGGCAVGVEIGVDFISIILTDFVADVLWRRRVPSDSAEGQEVIVKRAEELVAQALTLGQERGLQPLGIGLGVPGLVDVREGTLVVAPNLGWQDVPLERLWSTRFNLPVFVENEANAAALGEYFFGVARDVTNFIYLSAGVGLGGGIIIGSKLFRGSGGYAGEIGHMTMVPGGEPCGCGKRGCWETVAGPRAIMGHVVEALTEQPRGALYELVEGDLERVTVDIVVKAAGDGDRVALQALEEVGQQLGVGIANLINIFNPELVVLGGALSLAGDFLMPVVEQTVRSHTLAQPRRVVRLARSAHGADACVRGTVALVLDDILREPMPALTTVHS